MNYRKLFSPAFWHYRSTWKEKLDYDKKLYMHWSGRESLGRRDFKTVEWRYLILMRKTQANLDNIFGKLYQIRLDAMTRRTGIWIPPQIQCGNGIIIAHWGRIIVNPRTKIGNDFSISSGVVIGRDMRGRRKGVPVFGDRVVIKTNAAVIGNVTIGSDVLIAPNAYVNFDVPDHSIVVGNPGAIHPRQDATGGGYI